MVEFSFYPKKTGELMTGKEINITQPYITLKSDFLKNAVGIFLAEFLHKILRTEEPEQQAYTFVREGLLTFDREPFSPNFHLWFITRFLFFAGYAPSLQEIGVHNAFSLSEGTFGNAAVYNPHDTIEGDELLLFKQFLALPKPHFSEINSAYQTRRELLAKLLRYYHFHLPEMGQMNSSQILQEVLQ
jgi:DNA repair protein RecO (recombination protein O)